MKKKTCPWLDSNIRGGIQILNNRIYPCCGPSKPFYNDENLDYSKISIEELIEKRKELQEKINEGTACQGCEQIIEKEEEDINIGPITYLSIGLFSTCNLRCRYCYFTHDELSQKLKPERTHLLPFIKRLSKHGFMKKDFSIGLAGGEPTLFEDLPETFKFISDNYEKSSMVLLSNSSITSRTQKIIDVLKDTNENFDKGLYTSIDAGTKETYKLIRGRDLYTEVKKNIINYAKNNSFNRITLKYILMFDHSNTSNKDIFGFLFFFKEVMKNQKGTMAMTIDCDMLSHEPFDDEMIAAAGKLYYVARDIFGIEVAFCGGGLVNSTSKGQERIKLLQNYAKNYKTAKKPLIEKFYLFLLGYSSVLNNINRLFKLYKRTIKLIKILYFQQIN